MAGVARAPDAVALNPAFLALAEAAFVLPHAACGTAAHAVMYAGDDPALASRRQAFDAIRASAIQA